MRRRSIGSEARDSLKVSRTGYRKAASDADAGRHAPRRLMSKQICAGYVLAGKYRLERTLARGGMGELWVAEHLTLGEPVAVKLILTNLASRPDMSTRFKREAKAIAKLQRQTQHVVQIHDHGVDDGVPYSVMELLEGEDLNQRLSRIGRLTPAQALPLVAQLAKALQPAHQAGIVHRDLKLANIFLARKGDDEIVKVLDFGLAKGGGLEVVGDDTAPGDVLGSPRYMSPEQARGRDDLDGRSDLWSVAVLLFVALTGQPPFQSQKFGDLLLKICTDPTPLPSTIVAELPPAIDAFFLRALSKHRDDRYPSARAFVVAFAEALGAEVSLSDPGIEAHGRFSLPSIGGAGEDVTTPMPLQRELSSVVTLAAAETAADSSPASSSPAGLGATLTRATHQLDHSRTTRRSGTAWWMLAAVVAFAVGIVAVKFAEGPAPHTPDLDRSDGSSADLVAPQADSAALTVLEPMAEPTAVPSGSSASSLSAPVGASSMATSAASQPRTENAPADAPPMVTSRTAPAPPDRQRKRDEVFGF